MLKKLRHKFILIAMFSIAVVLFSLIAVINVINYNTVVREADALIELLKENNGVWSQDVFSAEGKAISPETPFNTRYFTVTLSESGNVIDINTENIAAISEEEAAEYALKTYASNKSSGFLNRYRYGVLKMRNGGTMYLFLYRGEELSAFYSFLWTSLAMSVGGMVIFFILVLVFSNLAVGPIAESYEKQKRFITDAGHELKTPLTIIGANTEVVEMEYGESEWTVSTKNQIARLTSLTENLILLARMDEANDALPFSEFSLTEAVSDTAQSFHTLAAARNKKLEISLEDEITVMGNERAIRQLLSLLIDNAIKYSSEDRAISVSLSLVGKKAEICVSNGVDHIGKGSHEEYFERFYRSDVSRNSETGGNGIGLSVAKAITEKHHGKITAFSEDETSIVFKVILNIK